MLLLTKTLDYSNIIVPFNPSARVIYCETIKMKLEDQIRHTIRFKHYSIKTEESYVGWYRRYVHWHGKKHPAEMGSAEVEAFLTHLAV